MLRQGKLWHTPGGFIPILSTEPPSRTRLIQASIKRNFRYAKRNTPRTLYRAGISLLALVAVFRYTPDLQAFSSSREESLSQRQREQTLQVVGSMISLITLEPVRQPSLAAVSPIVVPVPAQPTTYTVAAGESLSAIADSVGLKNGSLLLANPQINDAQIIHVGDVLTVPAADASADDLARLASAQRKKQQSVALAAEAATAKVAAVSTPPKSTGSHSGSYALPIHYKELSQGFSSWHPGVDLAADVGTMVVASHAGCIIQESDGWNGGYGRMIMLDHGDGTSSLYAHLSAFVAVSGQCVTAGQVIAHSGNTGRSTGPHLHFEIRKNGIQLDPTPYVH